jgi:hypothetical protein
VVSKRQIASESPASERNFASYSENIGAQQAQADEKAQSAAHSGGEASILKRFAAQPSDAEWGFETTSNKQR